MSKPYLSIIICGRNDNYGGDFTQRLQNFITWNTSILEKHKLQSEIIFVNWNPIKDKPSIKDSIKWTKSRKHVTYRIIDVPNEIHLEYCDESVRKKLPLYEYLAKNVGIKRAKGEYVLAMNPDIQIHENIIEEIALLRLQKTAYYRTNRIDFKNNDIKQQTRLWLKGKSYPLNGGEMSSTKEKYLVFHSKMSILRYSFLRFFNFIWSKPLHAKAENKFHCNVSGDFMMMHRDAWHQLLGNPERTYLALHTDALMVVIAATSGLKEIVFSSPIYHQEHARRFDATEKGNEMYRKAYLFFQNEAKKMITQQKPIVYSNDDWGLAKFELPEICF